MTTDDEATRQERREEKRRKKKERIRQHSKGLAQIYRNAIDKRKKEKGK